MPPSIPTKLLLTPIEAALLVVDSVTRQLSSSKSEVQIARSDLEMVVRAPEVIRAVALRAQDPAQDTWVELKRPVEDNSLVGQPSDLCRYLLDLPSLNTITTWLRGRALGARSERSQAVQHVVLTCARLLQV